VPIPAGTHQEDRGALSWQERAHERIQFRREVGTAMGFDVAKGAGQMLTSAQWPVNDEQVAILRHAVLMDRSPRLDRRDYFDFGQMTLEGLGEPDHERRAGRFTCNVTCSVVACPRGYVRGMRRNGEKAASYVSLDEVGLLAAAADHSCRVRGAEGRAGLCRLVITI
jgi:hypothetical protein